MGRCTRSHTNYSISLDDFISSPCFYQPFQISTASSTFAPRQSPSFIQITSRLHPHSLQLDLLVDHQPTTEHTKILIQGPRTSQVMAEILKFDLYDVDGDDEGAVG